MALQCLFAAGDGVLVKIMSGSDEPVDHLIIATTSDHVTYLGGVPGNGSCDSRDITFLSPINNLAAKCTSHGLC